MATRAADLPSLRSTVVTAGRRWLAAPAAAAAVGLLLAGGGCDSAKGKADKAVDEKVAAALPMLDGGATAQAEASKTLDDAGTDAKGGSKWQQVVVKSLKGDSELRLAQNLAARIAFYNGQAERLTIELGDLADAVEAANGTVAGMQKEKPDAALANVGKLSAAVTGSASKPNWVTTPAGSIASLYADNEVATAGAAEVERLQAAIKSETDDRDKALATGDQLADQSSRERGDKSVELYTQAANARKQAADLNVKIDADTIALGRAQADLDGVRQQQEAKRATLGLFNSTKTAVNANWTGVQGRMKTAKADAIALLGEPVTIDPKDVPNALTLDAAADVLDSKKLTAADAQQRMADDKRRAARTGGQTIRYKAALLAALNKQTHDLRGQAENHYNGAIGFYREAGQIARDLRADLNARMAAPGYTEKLDYPAVEGLAVATHPSRYNYQLAVAELGKAEFLARAAGDSADQIAVAVRLKAALDVDSLEMPTGLEESNWADLDARQKTSMKTAVAEFGNAVKDLDPLSAGGDQTPKEIKDAATAALMFAHYSWGQLELMPGGRPAEAQTHLDLAKGLANQTSTLTFAPPLPPGLSTPPAAVSPGMPMTKPPAGR